MQNLPIISTTATTKATQTKSQNRKSEQKLKRCVEEGHIEREREVTMNMDDNQKCSLVISEISAMRSPMVLLYLCMTISVR